MLQLLWGKREAGSASQLAEAAGVGFASAYRELRSMQSVGLVVAERKDGSDVYRQNESHPFADALRQLVAAPARPTASDADRQLRGHLKALGAPLQANAETPPGSALEETVVRGVQLARRDPDVARTLPVCLYRQRDALHADKLRHHALQLGEKRALGFFLELTGALSGDDRFSAWSKLLRDRRCTSRRDFFHTASRSPLERRVADARTPPVARRWGLRMNMDMDAFRSTFDKFVDVR